MNIDSCGVIRKDVSPDDGRQSLLSMTARGHKAFDPVERRSERQVGDLLGRLTAAEQDHLISAMRAMMAARVQAHRHTH